jgi:aminomethyltransferase
MAAGQAYGLLPAGMVALDIARIEAGLLLIEVDYISALKTLIPAQRSSPYDMGLDWTVALDPALEALFGRAGLVPRLAGRASRSAVPIYRDGEFIGQATSSTFSPVLKQYIAIATLKRPHGAPGAQVELEVTIEYERHKSPATIVKLPFFDPPRKRA